MALSNFYLNENQLISHSNDVTHVQKKKYMHDSAVGKNSVVIMVQLKEYQLKIKKLVAIGVQLNQIDHQLSIWAHLQD